MSVQYRYEGYSQRQQLVQPSLHPQRRVGRLIPTITHQVKRSPKLSDGYLHTRRVQSRFKKQASMLKVAAYTFAIVGLLFGLVQLGWTLTSDLYKLSILMGHQSKIEALEQETLAEKAMLKQQIAIYSSSAGVEELARNNLELVGPNEVLVRIRRWRAAPRQRVALQ